MSRADGEMPAGHGPGVAMSVGKPIRYVPGSDWQSYTEQLEFFFLANGIEDPSKKKAILLANVPGETFQLIKDLLAPTKLTDVTVTYGGVVTAVQNHVKPERSALVCRYALTLG